MPERIQTQSRSNGHHFLLESEQDLFTEILPSLLGQGYVHFTTETASYALVEAIRFAYLTTGRNKILISGHVHPHTTNDLMTHFKSPDYFIEDLAPDPIAIEDLYGRLDSDLACCLIQSPGFFGHLQDYLSLAYECRRQAIILIYFTPDFLSLLFQQSQMKSEFDIIVSEGQSLLTNDKGNEKSFTTVSVKQSFFSSLSNNSGDQSSLSEKIQQDYHEVWRNFNHHSFKVEAIKTLKSKANIIHSNTLFLYQGLKNKSQMRLFPSYFFNKFSALLPSSSFDFLEKIRKEEVNTIDLVSSYYPHYPELTSVLHLSVSQADRQHNLQKVIDLFDQMILSEKSE